MFNQRAEHYDSLASRWEINRERFAGEEIIDDDYEYYRNAESEEDLTPDLTDLVRQEIEASDEEEGV
jgi:hypothetical protein